ncbi:MAG: hypothetical protein ACI35Q_08375 [Marinilabiliaceae bacterium]
MAKYALSFTTQGNDLNTYYLAASVLGMVAAKNSGTYIYIDTYGFNSATNANSFQTLIDGVINSKYWQTKVQCYPAQKTYSPSTLNELATKTATSVGYVTSGSYSKYNISCLSEWLTSSSALSYTTAAIRQSLPYINYKISCMSETDYKAFVAAVIKAGGLSDYEQTNTPVQA